MSLFVCVCVCACVCVFRYLENCFRVHPPIEDDGSNLPEVLMQMWSNMVQEAPPSKALLGVKTIYVSLQGLQHAFLLKSTDANRRAALTAWPDD